MRLASLLVLIALSACASTKSPYPDAQAIVDRVAGMHSDVVRLTLHAVPQGKTQCTQIASTAAERRGKASDPEDLRAMQTGQQVVLDEPGAVDVTVPILMQSGKPTAVAGVTVRAGAGANRDALVRKARAVGEQLATEIRAAGKPVW